MTLEIQIIHSQVHIKTVARACVSSLPSIQHARFTFTKIENTSRCLCLSHSRPQTRCAFVSFHIKHLILYNHFQRFKIENKNDEEKRKKNGPTMAHSDSKISFPFSSSTTATTTNTYQSIKCSNVH